MKIEHKTVATLAFGIIFTLLLGYLEKNVPRSEEEEKLLKELFNR